MASRQVRNLAAAAVVLVAFVLIGLAWRLLVAPALEEELVSATSGDSVYDQAVSLHLDSFSGYAPLRSARMRSLLRDQGIRLDLVDDQADYGARIRALDGGDADLAVFTVDAFVLAGDDLGRFPGAIVAVLDETAGADAIVAYKEAVPTLRTLDDPKARLVLTPASPSEFLGRVAIAELGLSQLSRWWESANGAEEVFERLQRADRSARRGYVLWEPWVSRALEDPAVHRLFDSSQLSGYVVDVLVARRAALRDRPEVVQAVVGAWLTTLYESQQGAGGMAALVRDDAAATGDALTPSQAAAVADGIRWRNTLENYAYMGLVPGDRAGVVNLEDILVNIGGVLRRTGATPGDPVGDRAPELFYPGVLKALIDSDFHPAKAQGSTLGTADLRADAAPVVVPPLAEAEWEALAPVGSMTVDPISFGRGRASLHVQGRRELDALARRLRALPTFYLTVVGQARAEGDPDANTRLAAERAEAVRAHLVAAGVPRHRLRAQAAPPLDAGGAAQTVVFELGQRPY